MNNWFVYILKGKNGYYYKGLTNNINKRLHQHELGQNNTTRQMRPLILIYVEICSTRQEARNIEKYFKTGSGRDLIRNELDLNSRGGEMVYALA